MLRKNPERRHYTNLEEIRIAHGYSLREFARLLEIPLSTLSMAESGKRDLSTPALLKLARLEQDKLAKEAALSPEMGYCYRCMYRSLEKANRDNF
jgi:transcriptional regulator with XRE-family HTH domain